MAEYRRLQALISQYRHIAMADTALDPYFAPSFSKLQDVMYLWACDDFFTVILGTKKKKFPRTRFTVFHKLIFNIWFYIKIVQKVHAITTIDCVMLKTILE